MVRSPGEAVGNAGKRARYPNLPANVATPSTWPAGPARSEAHEKVTVEVMDRAAIIKAGIPWPRGRLQGGEHEPRLITLRYTGRAGARRSAWSASRSPSTPAASRSSPRPECTR